MMVRSGPRGPEMNPEKGRLLASAHEILRGPYSLLSCTPWQKWRRKCRSSLQMVATGRLGFRRWWGSFRRAQMDMQNENKAGTPLNRNLSDFWNSQGLLKFARLRI